MKLKNYDPARATSKDVFHYAAFQVGSDKIGERTLLIPPQTLDGKVPDEIRAHVQRTYEVFRRAEEYAEAQNFTYTNEKALDRATQLYTAVYLYIVANCHSIYYARLDENTEESQAEQNYLNHLDEKIDVHKRIMETLSKSAEMLCEQWIESNGPEHARRLVQAADFHVTKQVAAAAIFEADKQVPPSAPEEEWHNAFDKFYRARLDEGLASFYFTYTQKETQDILENELKPVEMPFEELRLWAGIAFLEGMTESGEFSDFSGRQTLDMVVATSKLAGHLNGFITNRKEAYAEHLEVRVSGRAEIAHAHSRLDLPKGTARPDAIGLLEKIHKTLLRHKEESASLLKTHLYLVDRAYRQGGDSPTFTVDMDELLEAKGYKRRADGSFQASTYREEWGRVATLAGCWLELRRVRGKNKRGKDETFIDETPYWEVRARRRLEEGEALGLETILLQNPEAPIIKAVVMQPGLWWGISNRGDMRFHLPHEVLALPTDGKGNETQRMAVQIAATLALWVRSSQNQHAGRELNYGVGTVLEASGIKTRLEFENMNLVEAGRLR